jgi:hypothetical protein
MKHCSSLTVTTDLQRVVVTLLQDTNVSSIRCDFISGSDAIGCMMVLISGNSRKALYNLIRNRSTNYSSITLIVTLERPPSCYTGV